MLYEEVGTEGDQAAMEGRASQPLIATSALAEILRSVVTHTGNRSQEGRRDSCEGAKDLRVNLLETNRSKLQCFQMCCCGGATLRWTVSLDSAHRALGASAEPGK